MMMMMVVGRAGEKLGWEIEKKDKEYWGLSRELSRILRFEHPPPSLSKKGRNAWGKERGKKRVGAASTDGGGGADTKDGLLLRPSRRRGKPIRRDTLFPKERMYKQREVRTYLGVLLGQIENGVPEPLVDRQRSKWRKGPH